MRSYIILILLCWAVQCSMSYRVPRHWESHAASNVQDTFIRFRLPALPPSENGSSPLCFSLQGSSESRAWHRTYQIRILHNFETIGGVPLFTMINPPRAYWESQYPPMRFTSCQWMRHFSFRPNCEYRMPAPAGKNRFRIVVSSPLIDGGREIESEHDIELPPHHSARILLAPGNLYDVKMSIEPNPKEEPVCVLADGE